MKRKIIKLLARIRRSKFFKIFFSSLVVISVLISTLVIPVSAEDSNTVSGKRLFNSILYFDDTTLTDGLMYVNSGDLVYGYVDFVSNSNSYFGMIQGNFSVSGPTFYNGDIVYERDTGWVSDSYRLVDFGNIQTVDDILYDFILRNSVVVDDPGGSDEYILSGPRIFNRLVDLSLTLPDGTSFSAQGLKYVTYGTNFYSVPFVSNGYNYLGYDYYTGDSGVQFNQGDLVYTSSLGWLNETYRYIDFGQGVSVTADIYSFIMANTTNIASGSYEDGYQAGLNVGYQYGYNDGYIAGDDAGTESGYNSGYSDGYDVGFLDGLNSTDSGNLGQNLIGSTLSAPFRALDNFILFTTPGGVDISLGFIFGGIIALIIFLAFLKMFAGG